MASLPPPSQDLASILQTLSQYSQNPVQQPVSHQDQVPPTQAAPTAVQQSTNPPSNRPHVTQTSPPPKQAKAPTDPSRITTYPAALRYTTSLLSHNPEAMDRVRKLLKSQHDHERQWWEGRSHVLIERQKKIDRGIAVGKLLGKMAAGDGKGTSAPVAVAPTAAPAIPTEEEALKQFDRKVYAAFGMMVKDVRRVLKEMGIPGFVVRPELVGEGEGKVSREVIDELEAKMLVLLEDLCKD